ncbi:MAG: hypothetical protein JW795_21700 [Chitinivibrionales bacterium]|nr:hypothetical protein [Chitinivibrionales bacterium]
MIRGIFIVLFLVFGQTVSLSNPVSERFGERVRLKKILIGKEINGEPTIFVVDKRAWDIQKCAKRIEVNKNDGDARFIMGNFYLLRQNYTEAYDYFNGGQQVHYLIFSPYDMADCLGYTLNLFADAAREKNSIDLFYQYLQKEQDVYRAVLSGGNNLYTNHFKYLYALTYIRCGLFLESLEKRGIKSHFIVTDSILIANSRASFETANSILSQFSDSIALLHESRAFVYEKLDSLQKSQTQRRLQGIAAKKALYEKQRTPIRSQILQQMSVYTAVTNEFILSFEKIIIDRYVTFSATDATIDSLKNVTAVSTAEAIVDAADTARSLTPENRMLLCAEISDTIARVLSDTMKEMQRHYLLTTAHSYRAAGYFERALQLLENNAGLFQNTIFSDSLVMLQASLRDSLRLTRKKEVSVKKLAAETQPPIPDKTVQKQQNKTDPDKKITGAGKSVAEVREKKTEKEKRIEKKQPQLPIVVAAAPKKKPEPVARTQTDGKEVPDYILRVSLLIDNLIEKKDYIGAYRGMRAYEKILKNYFSKKEIENSLHGLETIITQNFGEKYLKKVQKEIATSPE